MNSWRIFTWQLAILNLCLLSCNKDTPSLEKAIRINVNSKEILFDFIDINNHHVAENRYSEFCVVDEHNNMLATALMKEHSKVYFMFKPTVSTGTKGTNIIKKISYINKRHKIVAVVESSFKLDSVVVANDSKTYYYTNTENKVFNRLVESPVKILVGEDRAYREEGRTKFCVMFNFLSAKVQSTEEIDYNITIKGFMGKKIQPIQRGLVISDNPTDVQEVGLAIDGFIHNYYNAEGILQEPYEIVYEIVSEQLFGNGEKHFLRVVCSGDCYHNKIKACSFDGRKLHLDSIIAYDSFGVEYINLTIM